MNKAVAAYLFPELQVKDDQEITIQALQSTVVTQQKEIERLNKLLKKNKLEESKEEKDYSVALFTEYKDWWFQLHPEYFKTRKDWMKESPAFVELMKKAQAFCGKDEGAQKQWLDKAINYFFDVCEGKVKKDSPAYFLKGTAMCPSQMVSRGRWAYILEGIKNE